MNESVSLFNNISPLNIGEREEEGP